MRFSKYHGAIAPFLLLSAAIGLEGCKVSASDSCYTVRPNVVRPDPAKVYAHLSSGESGKRLAQAIFEGNAAQAAQLIDADPKLLASEVLYDRRMDAPPQGQYGDMLAFAVASCDIGMVQMLLEKGMPADGVQKGQALTLALLADGPEMAELLLRAGASPDPQKSGGAEVMRELIAFGAKGGVMTLLRHGADWRAVDQFGNDWLDVAISMEQYEIAELLVDEGANLWRIMGAGAIPAWQLSQSSVLEPSKEKAAARERLLAKAKATGLPWPPPAPQEVRRMVLDNKWPNAELAKKGLEISAEAKADIAKRFANEAAN